MALCKYTPVAVDDLILPSRWGQYLRQKRQTGHFHNLFYVPLTCCCTPERQRFALLS